MQVRHLPNRDRRRSGVATLKCASAHVPRFLTGSDPPISDRQLPSRPLSVAQAVCTAHRRAAARDGFLGCPGPK
jgi:hypothetical protein